MVEDASDVMAGDASVCVVLVSYNSASVILGAVQSIDPGIQVIVVDNASSDDTVSVLRDAGTQVIENATNVGFGRACNIGADASSSTFVFFLNPDARLRPGACAQLVQAAHAHPEFAALNPQILESDGTPSQRRKSYLLSPELNATLQQPMTETGAVEMLSGAALFCRRADFEAVGGFDENIFLYCEDDDLVVRMRKAGRKLGYVHDAIVEHIGGASTTATPELERFKSYQFMKGNRYAMRKHGIAFPRHYKIIQYAAKYAAGVLTRRDEQRAKYGGYLKALTEQLL